mmetsp:Transcript_2249/g.6687  ORF Transcript_2249/g.6687 Transcript_2249/m.6687 type:complete len:201 (-) Transcript_2249:57-659(-)
MTERPALVQPALPYSSQRPRLLSSSSAWLWRCSKEPTKLYAGRNFSRLHMKRCGRQCGFVCAWSPLGSPRRVFGDAILSTKPLKFMCRSRKMRTAYDPDRYRLPLANLSRYADLSRSAGSRKNTNLVQFGSLIISVASSASMSLLKSGLSERKCGSARHLSFLFFDMRRKKRRMNSVQATFGTAQYRSLCSLLTYMWCAA